MRRLVGLCSKRRSAALPALVLAISWCTACASEPTIRVIDPWSRPTPPGVSMGVIYMTLTSVGRDDRLLAIESDRARRIEVHETTEWDGISRMRRVPELRLDADREVKFEPGGLHAMMIGLHDPLAAGTRHTIVLVFENAGRIQVDIPVAAPEITH